MLCEQYLLQNVNGRIQLRKHYVNMSYHLVPGITPFLKII